MSAVVVDQVVPDYEAAVSSGALIKYPENGERMAKAAEFNQNIAYLNGKLRDLFTAVIEQMQENQRVFNEQISAIQAIVTNAPAAYDTLQKIGAELLKDDSTENAILTAIDTKASADQLMQVMQDVQGALDALTQSINSMEA